ncbi:MAG: hypothetical protein WCE49_09330 [Terrimicrobiaceae bacterium]
MNPLRLDKSRLVATLLMGFCVGDLFALTGCVYPYPGSEVVVGPPPVPGPSLNIGFYGTPAGYYYRNYPVYIYRGRPAYYYGGRRYYYRPGHRYHYRSGYRYYY